MQTTLRTRMRILILLLLLALGVGSIATFQYLTTQEVANRVEENLEDTKGLLRRSFTRGQDELLLKVALVAQQPTIKNNLIISKDNIRAGVHDPTLADNLESFCPNIEVDCLAMMNQNGVVVASSPKWPGSLQNLASRRGVESVFEGQDWKGLSAEDGKLYSIVVTPVPLSQQGWYGAMIGVKQITDEAAEDMIRFNESSDIVFLVGDKVLAQSRPFKTHFRTEPGIQEAEADQGNFVGVYSPLKDIANTRAEQRLGFVALQNFDYLTEFNKSAGTAFISVLVLMMIVGLILGERFTRSLVKPLDEVVQASIEMRKGQSPKPFDIGNRRDEISVLQMVFNDMVTAVEQNQKLLLGMIDTDPLTGLGNHRSFQEKVRAAITRSRQSQQPLSVLMIDIDHFHDYNQEHGHAAGDSQLKAYAGLLRGSCPSAVVLARYSGDQFVALLPNHTTEEATLVAERIRNSVKEESTLAPSSIGIATLDPESPNEEALVLSAELALSSAKQLGGDRISVFQSDLEHELAGGSKLMQQYLTDGSLATVQALAAAVDAKDQYTKGHSERVAQLARDLAEHMGCSPTFVELVYRAGTLHDVGKIGVPDAILGKPDRLTQEEMSVMETHPVLGEVIVAKVPQLSALLPGVRHHHERWDGKGYPDGLAGERIPMLARYLAVADTFDAMTSDRPYRTALTVDVALHEIEKCAGSQFQPELAMAFVQMVRKEVPAVLRS